MADLIFLNGFPNQQPVNEVTEIQVGDDGNTAFINPAYKFYAVFPALNLPPIKSNVPVLTKVFGWINGG